MEEKVWEQPETDGGCGAPQEDTAGVTAPDAGERQAFEELIRGEYKAEFDERVRRILDGRLRGLRRENETLRADAARQTRRVRAAFAALEQTQAQVQAIYPGFDWRREAEDGTFARLIAAGVPARTAYEAVHHDELMSRAMAYAARRTAEHRTAVVAASSRRCGESGQGSTAVSGVDVAKLSAGELADIRRRVLSGEKIRF